jgi:hypothetical protein
MKKGLKFLGGVSFFLCVALLSLALFFPWEAAGRFGGILLQKQLAPQGVLLAWQDLESPGAGVFRLFSPRMDLPMADLSLAECTLALGWGESLRRFAGVLDLSFGAGELRVFGKSLSWSGGSARIVYKKGVLHIQSFRSSGEFRGQGDLSISLKTRRIATAAVAFRIPPEKDDLVMPLQGFLPLRKGTEAGQWFLEREEGAP